MSSTARGYRERLRQRHDLVPGVRVSLPSFLDPASHGIFGFEMGCGRLGAPFGRGKATALLPIHAAIDHPLHDARQLGLELFWQHFVTSSSGIVTVKGSPALPCRPRLLT